ncbi:hypothetical protein ON010_g1472 [Phytophthora cinnamomi]|nr:hypothetical protein ON010_g1472 [Phytophthora cinnamomi]
MAELFTLVFWINDIFEDFERHVQRTQICAKLVDDVPQMTAFFGDCYWAAFGWRQETEPGPLPERVPKLIPTQVDPSSGEFTGHSLGNPIQALPIPLLKNHADDDSEQFSPGLIMQVDFEMRSSVVPAVGAAEIFNPAVVVETKISPRLIDQIDASLQSRPTKALDPVRLPQVSAGYPHLDVLMQIAERGVSAKWRDGPIARRLLQKNHNSCSKHLHAVARNIRHGQGAGEYLVVDGNTLDIRSYVICSPLGAALKKE